MNATGIGDAWELRAGFPDARRPGRGRVVLVILAAAVLWKLVVGAALAAALGFVLEPVPVLPQAGKGASVSADPALAGAPAAADSALAELRKEVRGLEAAAAAQAPRGRYIVVDRVNNRLWVRTASGPEIEAVVSTGSGTVLKEAGGEERTWTFETPTGRFKVLSERRDPVWVKPDWAFLEEGLPPPNSLHERRDEDSLGEWALDLGDGYMIHGTLYERLLGRSLTHGCIRVGRDDLRAVARAAHPGTPVIIF